MNLVDLFRVNLIGRSNNSAIHFEGRVVTFGDLDAQSNRMARALQRIGVQHGDRVAFYLNNSLELVYAYLANLKSGFIVVPMNTQYRDTEISHIIEDAAPRVLLTDRTQWSILEPLRRQFRSVERIIFVDELVKLLENESSNTVNVSVAGDDLALILYTSGTTGRSKGAMLSHNNLAANITGLVAAWGWTADDTLLLTLPLFHMHGLGVGLHGALATGCTTILHPTFRAGRVLDSLLVKNVTLFMGVPTMYVRLIEEVNKRGMAQVQIPQMRLFISGSAPLSAETFEQFENRFGHRILERYGMTETGMNMSNLYMGARIPGTVGVPLPGVSARVGDERGNAVPDGQVGEILLRGPNVFRGYWQAPEKTAEAFVTDEEGNRWFRTGDLGRRDPATGFYSLLSRRHDLIISGGFNIYPREVEDLLLKHTAVLEAAVIGARDDALGEVPVAFVVLRQGQDVRAEELMEYCGTHLARFKVPRIVTFLDTLPRNAMGKIEKKELYGRVSTDVNSG